jgi:NADPH:quinone reductase-like Zn-dependent oxidoreductase
MRAVVLTRRGPPEVLAVEQRPDPAPGPGEIRIAVEAAGVNFADLLARAGLYPDSPKPPCVLGYEVAGTVESAGAGVETPRVGERVVAGTRFNGQAELAVARAENAIGLPADMTAAAATSIPVNYATAFAALVLMAGLRPDERVLIHSAAGGVGTAATQIARHIGALVIGTASGRKHEVVRAQGADHVIDYRAQDVAAEVRRITGGGGVDVVLNALGPTTLRRDYRLLRPGGRLIAYGVSQLQTGERRDLRAALGTVLAFPFATMPWWKGPAILNENKGVFGLNMLHWWDTEGNLARVIGPLQDLVARGIVQPVVDSEFPFERAPDAHRRLMSGDSIGKVVLTPR